MVVLLYQKLQLWVLKNMKWKLFIICSLFIFIFTTSCSKETKKREIDSFNYQETTEVTNYVKIEMVDKKAMIIELKPEVAPITVANFQKLVQNKFYDNLTFHRIIKGFMIQGGDPDGNGTGGSKETIKGEFSSNGVNNTLSHERGVISMARNSISKDSASSQFFICHENSKFLDGEYAAFGKLIVGFDTLDELANLKVNGETPSNPPKIKSIRFVTINE